MKKRGEKIMSVIFFMGDHLRSLKINARDLSNTPLARIPKKMSRVCMVVCNTNRSYRQGNGVSPIMRSIEISGLFKEFGYDVYFSINPHVAFFIEYLKQFLNRTSERFILAYIGQGGDGGSETFIFDDQELPDESFVQIVNEESSYSLKVTLFSDFSAEKSIFSQPTAFEKPVQLISCTGDMSKSNEGADVFVQHFVRELKMKKGITGQLLVDSLRILLKRKGVSINVYASNNELLTSNIMDYVPKEEKNDLLH